ncbi:hypothetical protein ACTFIV_002264 [Dictyostelium citrinum]
MSSNNTQTVPPPSGSSQPSPPAKPGNYAWVFALFNAIIGIPPSSHSIFQIVWQSNSTYCMQSCPNSIKLSIFNHSKPVDIYSILFDIPSIFAVKDGWEIKSDGSLFANMFLNLESLYSKMLVALSGDYNSGKTFLINMLENKNYNSSFHYATPAFGFIESFISPYVYMDTQGLKRLASSSSSNPEINRHSIKDIKAIDNLITQSYKLADIIIEVRDTGNNEDICNTEQRHSEYLDEKNKKIVVVVHNFKSLETESEVERFIHDDITNPEIGGKLTISSAPGTVGCSYWHVGSVYHYVLAKQGSKAGDIYNQCTIDLIRSTILVNKAGIPEVNFLFKLLKIFEQSLRNYIKDPNVSKDAVVKVKKDETLVSQFKNLLKSIYSPFNSKVEEPVTIETHPFKVKIDNNKIKLVNSSFNLEFSYKDCCGFKNIDYTPQYDVIQTSNSYGIAIDVPNSIVNWYCSSSISNKIYVYIERKVPTYLSSHLIRNYNQRTYGEIFKEFEIPTIPWINCNNLVLSAKYQDGVAFVSLSENNDVSIGSPFPNEDKK